LNRNLYAYPLLKIIGGTVSLKIVRK